MRQVIQMTQEELAELIILKLTEDGMVLKDAEFSLEFVTSADGKTSAIVQGVYPEVPGEKTGSKKKRTPEQQAARDVLGGSGSAMGRGEALGISVSQKDRRR